MGFGTTFTSVTNTAVTNATALMSDISAPIALIFGVAVLGLVLGALRSFLPR